MLEVEAHPRKGSIKVRNLDLPRDSEVLVTTLTGNAPTLELKGGSLVSQVDRAKLAGRTYGVKTPRGVAAARGTVYTVNVQGTTYTVVTASGTVTISAPSRRRNGGATARCLPWMVARPIRSCW